MRRDRAEPSEPCRRASSHCRPAAMDKCKPAFICLQKLWKNCSAAYRLRAGWKPAPKNGRRRGCDLAAGVFKSAAARKPNSVSRHLAMIGGDHFSGTLVAKCLKRPTAEVVRLSPHVPGWALPPIGLADGGVYCRWRPQRGAAAYRTFHPTRAVSRPGGIFSVLFPSDCSARR